MPPKAQFADSQTNTPKGWPSDVAYLQKPSYSRKLEQQALQAIVLPRTELQSAEACVQPLGPTPKVKIVSITNPAHPAHGQQGLFATQNLLPGSLIIPYLGFVHGKLDTDDSSDYDLSLDRELSIGVDATKMGNEARFINDYRGVGPPGPNAEFRETWADLGNGKVEKRMAVFVLSAGKAGKRSKGITKGEEILVSYGKGFWNERQKDSV